MGSRVLTCRGCQLKCICRSHVLFRVCFIRDVDNIPFLSQLVQYNPSHATQSDVLSFGKFGWTLTAAPRVGDGRGGTDVAGGGFVSITGVRFTPTDSSEVWGSPAV